MFSDIALALTAWFLVGVFTGLTLITFY